MEGHSNGKDAGARTRFTAIGQDSGVFGVLSRTWAARFALTSLVLATLGCVIVSQTPDPTPPFVPPPGATRDLDVFRRVVDRVSVGDSFYSATQEEFRSHDYPTRSVFNWRTPIYAWFLGRVVGLAAGRWLLIVLALSAVFLLSYELRAVLGFGAGALGGILLVGSLAWCFGAETVLFTELWAGVLIALSLAAFQSGLRYVGVTLGIIALFYRELALPYVASGVAFAVMRGRWREVAAWAAGLTAFLVFLLIHAAVIRSLLTEQDARLAAGWVRFGGVRFLLATAQTNVFLMPLPLWVTAVYLPLACTGLAGVLGDWGRRVGLAGAAYLVFFAVAGNPFNFYWGFISAPILAIGAASAPAVLRRLCHNSAPQPPRNCLDAIEQRLPGLSGC